MENKTTKPIISLEICAVPKEISKDKTIEEIVKIYSEKYGVIVVPIDSTRMNSVGAKEIIKRIA